MTLIQAYIFGKKSLEENNEYDVSADVMCLMEKCFRICRHDLIVNKDKPVSANDVEEFKAFLDRRKEHEPLQYILGEWEFMGSTFKLGTGVFIPRYDTEVLVDETLRFMDKEEYMVAELCSGSGAIAISIGKSAEKAKVVAIERSKEAFKYLVENVRANDCVNVEPINADIFKCINDFCDETFDIVVSNPPYIKTCDIENLDDEVKKEPLAALDGGDDGLMFYRKIADVWRPKLKSGGVLLFEVGISQKDDVKAILKDAGFFDIYSKKDLAGIDRVVIGKKQMMERGI